MSSPFRLGYLVPEFPAQTHIFFWREIAALRELGCELELISTRRPDPDQVKHAFAREARAQTTYLHPPALSALRGLLDVRWLWQAAAYALSLSGWKNKLIAGYAIILAAGLRQLAKARGIQHIHGHSCAQAAHILALAELQGGPSYSLCLHGGLDVYGDNHPAKFQRAHFVATVTRPLQESVKSLMAWPDSRVPVISMGVNLAPYLVRQRPPAVAFDASHPMQLISVARLARGKGHVYALEALAKLRQQGLFWRYSLVGAGPDTDWIREQVVRLNLADWVTFCGTQDEAAVREMLFSHHLLLLTSVGTFEAAPVCVMEAMASAMPTVTSHIGGTPDMIRHEVDGFLVPQADVEAIVEAINRVYHDPAVLQQMGLQARIRAIAEFDARAQALKLWEALPTPEATAD